MIKLESKLKDYSLLIPTSVKEITPEHYEVMLNSLILQDHYCVIALVHKIKLFSLASVVNAKNPPTVEVIPIIAKVCTPNEDIKERLKIGYRAVINRSSLEMGTHYNSAGNDITLTAVNSFIDDDKELRNDIITGDYFKEEGKAIIDSKNASPKCCFVEFKIVPINNVIGAYEIGGNKLHPFVEKNNESVN